MVSEVLGAGKKDAEKEDQAVQELVEHLKSIAPFNKRWQVMIRLLYHPVWTITLTIIGSLSSPFIIT